MSIRTPLDVPKLVKNYREQFPEVDRDFLRRLIRTENCIVHPSDLKRLDRYLARAFPKKENLEMAKGYVQAASDYFLTEYWKSLFKVKDLGYAEGMDELNILIGMLPQRAQEAFKAWRKTWNEEYRKIEEKEQDRMKALGFVPDSLAELMDFNKRFFCDAIGKIADLLHSTLIV